MKQCRFNVAHFPRFFVFLLPDIVREVGAAEELEIVKSPLAPGLTGCRGNIKAVVHTLNLQFELGGVFL